MSEIKKDKICCLCGGVYEGFGHNPDPVCSVEGERCCSACNALKVVPYRNIIVGRYPFGQLDMERWKIPGEVSELKDRIEKTMKKEKIKKWWIKEEQREEAERAKNMPVTEENLMNVEKSKIAELQNELQELRNMRRKIVQERAIQNVGMCFRNVLTGEFARIYDIPRVRDNGNGREIFIEDEYPAVVVDTNLGELGASFLFDQQAKAPYTLKYIYPFTGVGWTEISESRFDQAMQDAFHEFRYFTFHDIYEENSNDISIKEEEA